MTPATSPEVLTPERRTALFYLTVFMSGGASATALPLWLNAVGMSSEQIGVINAAPVFAMLMINMLVGRVADRASDWRQVIVTSSVAAALASMALFFVSDFWGIVVVWTLATLPNAGIVPVLDAAAMRLTKRRGTDFGTLRAYGTVGYMALNAGAGFVVAAYGAHAFVPLLVGVTVLRAASAFVLPRFRDPAATDPERPRSTARLSAVMKPWFLLPLIGFAIIFATHATFNAFCALMWRDQGISESIIGPLVALAAFGEAILMFAWRRVAHRFTARHLILASTALSILRWGVTALAPPLPVIALLQLSHAVSYALGFLGCIAFITNWTSEDVAAEAQGMFVALQQGMAVLALLTFGWLYGLFGVQAFFIAAAFAACGALCVWSSLRMQQPKG